MSVTVTSFIDGTDYKEDTVAEDTFDDATRIAVEGDGVLLVLEGNDIKATYGNGAWVKAEVTA